MRVEIVAVGTELLLGQIVDTNSAWLGEQLAGAGLSVLHSSCVGDNIGRIVAQLRQALGRADAVIVCGGLGPTQDDVTRDAIAEVMGVDLVPDDEVADRIRQMFAARGRTMPENNLRQALVPLGARTMDQQPGTAPGLVCEIGDTVLFSVPDVPRELREMVLGTVLPELAGRSAERGESAVVRSRVLRTWGLAESRVAELLDARIAELDENAGAPGVPTIAFLASGAEGIKVRLTVRSDTEEAARQTLAAEEALVRGVLGDVVFGVDDDTMESVVLGALRERGWLLGVAESLTAGYVCGRLARVPGASDVLRGGVVSYASQVKRDLLGVPDGPVISETTALAMARGALTTLGAQVGVATTGVAGPDTQEGQPVGTVCLAAVTPDAARTATVHLPGDRETIRSLSVISVLDLLRRCLLGLD
ncbi:MAG: competence/damage-inducible protein A [Actinomycetales bacterium]